MGRVCGTYGGDERSCSVLVRKAEGKRSLGKPRLRWEDNNKVGL